MNLPQTVLDTLSTILTAHWLAAAQKTVPALTAKEVSYLRGCTEPTIKQHVLLLQAAQLLHEGANLHPTTTAFDLFECCELRETEEDPHSMCLEEVLANGILSVPLPATLEAIKKAIRKEGRLLGMPTNTRIRRALAAYGRDVSPNALACPDCGKRHYVVSTSETVGQPWSCCNGK